MKKFELTNEFLKNIQGVKIFRIKALVNFGNVKAGELGGYVEKEENLSQYGNAWVYDDAEVYGDARVYGNAEVCGNAEVYGNAEVCGDAWVYGNARVYGDARMYGDAWVYGNARVYGDARMYGDAWVHGNAEVCGNAEVYGDARVCGNAEMRGNGDYATVKGFGTIYRTTTFFRLNNGKIGVKCGCFYGTLEEFRKKVTATHGVTKKAKEYLMLADLMQYKFCE